jgi:hypothetical protein
MLSSNVEKIRQQNILYLHLNLGVKVGVKADVEIENNFKKSSKFIQKQNNNILYVWSS